MNIQRKKILYIHHGKGIGGAPLSLLYLIKSLDKTKYHPVVLFLHASDAFNLYKNENIEVMGPVNRYDFPHTKIWWFKWYHLPYLLRIIKDTFITYYCEAQKWFIKIKPDIVHLNTSSLIAWGAIAYHNGIPIVWHVREPLADGYIGLRRQLIKHCVKKYATKIIPICNSDSRPWAYLKKTAVIYNPVDQETFDHTMSAIPFIKKYNLKQNAPTILFLGGISQEKGTLTILNVFKILLQRLPDAHLLVAGYLDLAPSPLFKRFFSAQKYKNAVQQALYCLQNSVTILGPINNVPQVMAASTVIVFPATVGHFARPVIEAGFMKKPVIASDLPALDELVINGKTGFLVSPYDIDQWVKVLAYILKDTEQQSLMGEQAYTFCKHHFDLLRYGKKIAEIYDQLANKGD